MMMSMKALIMMIFQDNKDIPLLVLANKQDLQTALSAPDIEEALGEIIYYHKSICLSVRVGSFPLPLAIRKWRF